MRLLTTTFALSLTACGAVVEQGNKTLPAAPIEILPALTTNSDVLFSLSFAKLKNRSGQVCFSIFDNKSKFPDDADGAIFADCYALSNENGPILDFLEPNRDYAIAAFHDKNSNGKLDKRKFGPVEVPSEGYGFSRNPDFEAGAPEWNKVRFSLTPGTHTMEIEFIYLF